MSPSIPPSQYWMTPSIPPSIPPSIQPSISPDLYWMTPSIAPSKLNIPPSIAPGMQPYWMTPSITPSLPNFNNFLTPSIEIVQEIDFSTLYFTSVNNGTYNAGDCFSFSDKFNNDIPDFSDIKNNYIGIDNLQIIIENIYYRGQDLSSTNETPCSISVKPSTNNCIQYRNIYYSLTNLLNDLYLIWSFVTDPKDKVNGIIGDMINSIYLLISFY
jgi:hypothetical protein